MDVLAREGLIVRRRGKGTYVAPRRVRSDLSIFSGFYDALVAAGLEIDVELLGFGPRAGTERDLLLPYATTLFVERLYSTGGEPIAVSRSALHPRAATLQRENVAGRTNYQVLTELCNFEIGRSELAIRAKLPDEAITHLLRLGARDPIMELHRATFSAAEEPLGRSVFWVTAGRFEFSLSAQADRDVVHALRAV
jgi:GntR family transcriptional regulator